MSKHIRKILPLLLCLLLMACLLPAAYADGELKLTWPSKVVVPPTQQDISVRHMVGDYLINSDGILDLLFDGYTISCFYDEDGLFSGGNIHWLPNSESGVYYNAWTQDGDLSAVDSYMGSYALSSVGSDLYRTCDYFFDLDGNVTEVRFLDEDGTDYHWKPAYNGQPAEGWFYYDQNNNFEKVYVDLDKEMRTDEIPGYAIQITNETAKFWVEEALPQETSVDGLLAAIANNETEYVLNDADEITGTLVIPEGFRLQVNKMLLVNGTGHLTNNGVINLGTSGVLRIGGVFQGNPGSRIEVLDADLANIRPRVIIENGGEFKGMGGVGISQSILNVVDRSAIIYGADLSQWCEAVDKYNGPGYFPGKDIVPEIFVGMCESGRFSQIRLRGTGNLSLTDNLTIPEGVYLKVRNGSTLTVPAGKTLTINGKIEASFNGRIDVLGTLQNNGEIEMFDGGVIAVTGTFKNNGRGVTFQLENPNAPTPQLIIDETAYVAGGGLAFYAPINPADAVPNINLGNYCHHIDYKKPNQTVYYPGNVMTFEPMFPTNKKYIKYLEVHGLDTLTLSANVEIPVFDDGTLSHVEMQDTTLIVPNGVTLTIKGELNVKALEIQGNGRVIVAKDTGTLTVNNTLTVAGLLMNNNKIILGKNAEVVMRQKSIYSGLGTVTRGGESYTIWNSKDSADLILPENLTTIESEAFANGRYGSAYIPPSVTSIALDAFGDKQTVAIYGEPGTEATRFAINKGFLFAPVEPSNPAA